MRWSEEQLRAYKAKHQKVSQPVACEKDGPLERQIQEQIADWLNLHEYAFIRPRMDKKTTIAAGWPDFTLAMNGKAVAFEVKKSGGKLSEDQIYCQSKMRVNGWSVHTVTSLPEVIEAIKQIKSQQEQHRHD